MMMGRALLSRLALDATGSALIETAIVTPALLVLALGTFDAGQMVARQHSLQAGAADTESIVLAVANGTATDTSTIKTALATSTGLAESKITVDKVYRCDAEETLSTSSNCGTNKKTSTYVKVKFTDTYKPLWKDFGIGGNINYNVERMVQVS
jgi:Flp pilus assembly protein TadG